MKMPDSSTSPQVTMRRQPLSNSADANRRSAPVGCFDAWSPQNSCCTFRTAFRMHLISRAMLISSGLLTFAGHEASSRPRCSRTTNWSAPSQSSTKEVRPFTEKQIVLLRSFADQAVIAIENARLLNELRQRTTDLTERTADLTEALEQQTATSDVLQVISSSPGDLQPVFATMLEKAVRICDATFGNIYRWDGDALHLVAAHNTPPAFAEARRSTPFFSPGPKTVVGRMVATKTVIHVADLAAEQAYIKDRIPPAVAAVELGGVRTILAVPMLNKNELIGSFTVYRQEVRPFTDKQIDLVQNFAAQAVIAIENARLLSELREKTEDVVKLNQQLEQRVADQVGEIERMSRLRRFLPPQVADLIVASGTEKQLESHRREITALFCDLRGFTGFCSRVRTQKM